MIREIRNGGLVLGFKLKGSAFSDPVSLDAFYSLLFVVILALDEVVDEQAFYIEVFPLEVIVVFVSFLDMGLE